MAFNRPKQNRKPAAKRSRRQNSGNPRREKSDDTANPSSIGRPPELSSIRRFLEVRREFAVLLGQLATFRIVVDANILIRDLLWLLTKRRDQNVKPALLECLESKTIVAHVTPRILEEVARTMQGLAAERGFSDQAWRAHWDLYLSMLIVIEPDQSVTEKYKTGRDPTDAPTLALAETPDMDGIFSSDADIKAMGGKVIPLTFKLEARDYSRKATIQISLQIGGIYIAAGAVEVLMHAVRSLAVAIRGIGNLPGWMMVVLAVGSICLAVHPSTRRSIQNALTSTERAFTTLAPELFSLMARILKEYELVRAKPPSIRYI